MEGNCAVQFAELFHFHVVPCRSCCGFDPVLPRNTQKHRTKMPMKCDFDCNYETTD